MLNQNVRNDHTTHLVKPIGRGEYYEEWLADPQAVFDRADEANLTLDSYNRVRSPASAESPGSAAEYILYNEGIRVADTFDSDSSPLDDLPEIAPGPDAPKRKEPIVRQLEAYWDECYSRTLFTGTTTTERNVASVSNLTAGGPWRPYADEPPVRTPDVGPDFNFLDVVAYTRRISGTKFRIPERKNPASEQLMQVLAEATPPRLMELTRGIREVTLLEYGAGIEASDKFLNDNQTRVSDITNAVEEIALRHRQTLLSELGKLVKNSRPTDNNYVTSASPGSVQGTAHVAGRLLYPFWQKFVNDFPAPYNPDTTIGNPDAILGLDLMSLTGDDNLTFGSWGLIPGSGVRKLNRDPLRMNYGSINNNTVTGFINTELYTWQRARGVVYVQQIGADQDETQRIPGAAKVQRWMRTTAGLGILDPECIRSITFT